MLPVRRSSALPPLRDPRLRGIRRLPRASRKSITEAAWQPWHLLALHIGPKPVVTTRSHRWLRLCVACSFDDCLGEGLRGFLRKIVADTARDQAMLVFA